MQALPVYSFALAATLVVAGCDSPPPSVLPPAVPSVERSRAAQPDNQRDFKDRQMAFLNRLRQADPQARTIERALLNEQNELGLILDRTVEMDKISALMRTMLTEMAREFPGEDLTVIAYTPSTTPRKIGTARLDVRTRDMTYTPEK